MGIRWVEVSGFEKYEVSDAGIFRNKSPRSDRAETLRGTPDKNGYLRHGLRRNGRTENVVSHRLVWASFNRPIPFGMQINHKNGIKDDNRLENLEICTASENKLHSIHVLGKKPHAIESAGSKNGRAKLKEADIPVIRLMLKKGDTCTQISALFNVSPAAIHFIQNGTTWTNVPLVST